MKRLYLNLIAVIVICSSSFAQNTFPTNGNVGIGTLSPGFPLHIVKPYVTSTDVPIQRWDPSIADYNLTLSSFNSNAGIDYRFTQLNRGVSYPVLTFKGGYTGVGTTNPAATLDVGKYLNPGELATVLARLPEGGNGTYLGVRGYDTQPSAATPTLTDIKSFSIEHAFYGIINSSINFLRGGGTIDGGMSFNTLNNTERMRIIANGNVGIGTATPDSKLAVNGTIHTKEVRVDLNGWADYVFAPSYQLPTLSEVKTYIDQNHHLPDIPSEKEVTERGLNLGNMNKLLLKKVEELTLYLIEKDKQIQEQQKQIDQLRSMIKFINAK